MNTSHITIPGLHVGRGTSAGGLTVFPVWVDTPALAGIAIGTRAHISVAELDQGPSVGQLVVHNAGRTAALLVEGELLEGGWQHRALNKGILLESGGTRPVQVSCVEAGRWHGGASHTRRARRVPVNVTAGLRRNEHDRQSEVWSRVDRFEGVRATSPTRSLVDHLDAPTLTRPRLEVRPLDGQRGVIVGLGGIPAWLELFPDPRGLAAHWDGILAAADLSADLVPERPTLGQSARDFAVAVERLRLTADGPAGIGTAVRADHHGVSVRGVCRGRDVAHLSAMLDAHPLIGAA
jgi:hypothetical protein